MAIARSLLRIHGPRVSLLTGFFLALVPTVGAASAPLDLTELVSTGNAVGRLGHIGSPGLRLHGIADDGKVLVGVHLSDGRFGLVLADGNAVVPLWFSHTPSGETPAPWFASIEPSGRVIATTDLTASTQTVYEVTSGTLRRIAGAGDVDSGGRTLCGFYAPRINSNGAAAFYGYAKQGADCTAFGEPSDRAIYTTAGGLLRRVADGVAQRLTGIADDGTVVLSTPGGQAAGEVTRWYDGQSSRVVGGGDIGPSGGTLQWVFGMNAGRTGEVLFSATEDERVGLYRTDQGRIIRVLCLDDQPPIGLAFERIGNGDGASAALE